MVHLYYWKARKNAGDYYSYWLAKKLYKEVDYTDANPNLIIAGSIIGHKALTNNTIVWGAGWHNSKWSNECKITDKSNFKAVRGKLTAEFLDLDSNITLGDPGLLASKYFDASKIQKKRKILIICHWQDYKDIYAAYHNKYDILSMETNDVENILTAICESELVLSSSLHGIIFAHSFGVPAVHLELYNVGSVDNFKFKDYYSVLDIPYTKFLVKDKPDFTSIYNAKNKYFPSKTCIKAIQEALLANLPAEETLYNETACLCAIAKNENNYIREWVEHYKKIGFTNIILYDNNDINGERFTDAIGDYIESGFVKIKDIRGLANQQIKCYNDFYHSEEALKYNWIAFFDIDEFLYLDDNKTVYNWLQNEKYKNFDAIAINWKYFDDNDLIKVIDNNYSITRFTREFQEQDWEWAQHRFSKRIVRTGKELVINSSHGPIAAAQMNEYKTEFKNTIKVCNIAGTYIPANTLAFSNWSHNGGYLAHYRYKTIEEYITNKMKRGYPTLYKNSGKDMSYTEFFTLNDKTPEKLKCIADITGIQLDKITITCKEIKKNTAAKKEKPNKAKKVADGQSNTYLYF